MCLFLALGANHYVLLIAKKDKFLSFVLKLSGNPKYNQLHWTKVRWSSGLKPFGGSEKQIHALCFLAVRGCTS